MKQLLQTATNPMPATASDKKIFLTFRHLLSNGGYMQRFLIALFISLGFLSIAQESKAQYIVDVSGYLLPGQTRTFYARTPNNTQTDTIYRISGYYNISGKLIIQPGAEVHFLSDSRMLDSTGGKIIANGFDRSNPNILQNRILIRGINVNSKSYEWGHIVVLPGADSVFFANVRFAFMRKKESLDNVLCYGNTTGAPLNNSLAIIQASNGVGGVMTTFSQKTWLYDVIVDSCQAIYKGGAFAFLQAPSNSYFPSDDGRFALVNHQVRKLLIRDTRVFNETAVPNSHTLWPDTGAYGGAIYISARNQNATTSDFRSGFLGYTDSNIFHLGVVTNLDKYADTMHFERCTVNNPAGSTLTPPISQQAYGGAIYVGNYSALTTALIGCYSDSAIAASGDLNMRGGAIYVSKLSADPSWLPPPAATSRAPGLAVMHRGSFRGNVAGLGGAIYCDWQNNGSLTTNGPALNIDGDNVIQQNPLVRDSGLIQFISNTAYYEGGAIYQNWYTYVTGFLSTQTTFPIRWDSMELRVRFFDNCAGIAGGSVYLNPSANPDYQIRRSWHVGNFVNPLDTRINRPAYEMIVLGGGAEFLGTRDSCFAVEYYRNYVINGNGGAIYMNMGQSGPGVTAYNRFLVENQFNALNPSNSNVVLSIAVTNPGTGYTSAPAVIISGGAGAGATAIATVTNPGVAGFVSSITVTAPGLYYTSAPTVTLVGGGGIGAAATATISQLNVPMPFDPRELTRFCQNWVNLGSSFDSVSTFNRNGRGGALYVAINNSVSQFAGSIDSLYLSRVRMEMNQAFTGSAIHSDNYRLNLNANQTLIANNFATSRHNATTDLEKPDMNNPGDPNAGATIYGDFEGPQPVYESNSRGNAIYDNVARYILREPDAPHGFGGVDTLRGNFWGETGPDIITQLPTLPIGAIQRTFFVDYYTAGCLTNVYEANRSPSVPYTFVPIGTVPDTLLFEGRIYDIFDKGLDIKTVDYNPRRLAITEAFSLGLPTDVGLASKGRKGLHRWTRDIFSKDPVYLNKIMQYQIEFTGPHPIGYPLFLSADIDTLDFNRDACARNYTTVFVFNETTQEFVRVNLKEETQDGRKNGKDTITFPYKGRLDFVPDSTVATRHPAQRARVFWSPSLIRPADNTYQEIARAAKLEDSAALDGRAYNLSPNDILNNTTGAADSVCYTNSPNTNTKTTTWYAGERYHTLPVRPGDVIDVFSRTQLWKYGFAGAKTRGLSFVIGDVLPPFFVSDVAKLQNDPVNPNRLFVREDSIYNKYAPGQTKQVLFRIGGYDVNNFYDPRWLFDPYYTMLDYSVTFANMDSANFRLPWWISRDTVRNVNPTVGSNGYVQLYGTPHNPDVVPGGEPVHVVMTNYPPNFVSEHGLIDPASGANVLHPINGLGPDSLLLSEWIFPPYMNCPQGFLTDTLCVRSVSRTYDFRIYVQDSLPRFLDSVTTGCNGTANFTDRLRFDFDINTDDELEDSTVAAYTDSVSLMSRGDHSITWDFRYGRTSYKDLVAPQWIKTYIDTSVLFKTKGIIHIDLDAATASAMITPTPQVNGELLLDTIVAVQADDGHAGLSTLRWHAIINVAPKITTDTLPNAKEDFDYSLNSKNLGVVNKINITDPNFSDNHTFHLVYKGSSEIIYKDNRYKAGRDSLIGTTPLWLQINPISGVLSGTPGQNDAPHDINNPACGGPDTVLVVVEDQCGLADWKSILLNVDSTNHPPHFTRGPRAICVQNKTTFCDSISVVDKDLTRMMCSDSLSFTLINPTGPDWSIKPPFVKGRTAGDKTAPILTSDTAWVQVCGKFNFDGNAFPIPAQFIQIAVSDNSWGAGNPAGTGNTDTLTYKIYVGDIPTFECAVYVSNKVSATHPNVDIQRLCFGAAGAASDSLDIRYCEFEIPPTPNTPVFDARWELPVGGSLKGSLIDIRLDTNQYSTVTWQIRFNAGSDNGAFLYPIRICWRPSCLDTTGRFIGAFYLVHESNPKEFSIDMKTGSGNYNPSSYKLVRINSDSLCLEIYDVAQKDARIIFVPPKSAVPVSSTPQFALEQNYPNPFNASTRISFSVAERSNVRIEIYDIKGSLVKALVPGETLEAGEYPVIWDGTDSRNNVMPSGTYVCKMTAGDFTQTLKMTLNK